MTGRLEGEFPDKDGAVLTHAGDELLLWADLDACDGGAVAGTNSYNLAVIVCPHLQHNTNIVVSCKQSYFSIINLFLNK